METNNGKKGKPCSSQQHPEDEFKEYQAKFKALFDNVSSGVAIYDDKGNSLGHRESIRDITARKEAEQALEKAEQEKEKELRALRTLLDKKGLKE